MKINGKNWQPQQPDALYHSNFTKENEKTEVPAEAETLNDTDTLTAAKTSAENLQSNSRQDPTDAGASNFKISCSIPDDTTGQLAAMLARAESQMDVQQVSSKALRALNALKMSAVFAEGDDAKKAAQRIRRMEKLINRISKKQQQLNKEEVLELQRRSAEKRKERQRELELSRELDAKRTKRRKDERNYANREIAEDNKEATQEMYANMAAASSPAPDLSAPADLGGTAADLSMAEGAGIDLTV